MVYVLQCLANRDESFARFSEVTFPIESQLLKRHRDKGNSAFCFSLVLSLFQVSIVYQYNFICQRDKTESTQDCSALDCLFLSVDAPKDF